MLSLLIAVAVGTGVMMITSRDLGTAWGVVCGLFMVMLVQLLIGLAIRRRINRINDVIQKIMETAQAKINRKIQMFQQRPGGNLRAAQQQLEKEQAAAVREAIAATDAARPYYKWNFMLKKQISTMRMLLYYQIRDFAEVDRLMPDCVFFDARSMAFKLARMYKTNDPGLDRFFQKKARRLKGEDCALVWSLYAYIQVRRGDVDGALKTLVEAKKRTDNPVVLENWERLANGKVKHFSNAGLGDLWYSLYLEEPKIKPQRVQQRPY